MTALLLAPHNDDETLFAAFTLLKHRPLVVVCLRSDDQRTRETNAAMQELGCEWRQWAYQAGSPDWQGLEQHLGALDRERRPDVVFAPAQAWDENGHEPPGPPPPRWGVLEHDMVGLLADKVFGGRVRTYCTYTRWGGRQRGELVEVEDGSWVLAKLRALACYETQISNPATRPHFLDELREYRR